VNLVIGASVWMVVKWFIILALVLYLIFAFVIIRQVQLMTKTLEVGFEGQIRIISYLHLIAAIAVLMMALIVL